MTRPNQHLSAASQLYRDAWKQTDELRGERGSTLPKWPAWCFLPMAGWYAVASEGESTLPLQRVGDVGRLAALGAWRLTQGIYRFDSDLYAALIDTVLVGEIPSEVLLRLPEWGLYIETPGLRWMNSELYGVFVHLEWDVNTERRELRLLIDSEASLDPVPVHLGPWTLTEAMDRVYGESKKQAENIGLTAPTVAATMDRVQQLSCILQPILSLVLYICSDEPDISDRQQPGISPERPQPKKTRHGWRLFPPKKPRIWSVGDTVGATLRAGGTGQNSHQSEHHSPRPHIRRAHWHGYWVGSHDGERKFRYHWLPPMVVAGEK